MSRSFDSEAVPPQSLLPNKIPPALFKLRVNACWKTVSGDELECGLVVGLRYVWSKYLDWQYQYYIALNTDSLSYRWAKFDWGCQEDLALTLPLNNKPNSEEINDQ